LAKKYNKGRPQKRNVDKYKLEKYREEIAEELGVPTSALTSKEKQTESKTSRKKRNGPLY